MPPLSNMISERTIKKFLWEVSKCRTRVHDGTRLREKLPTENADYVGLIGEWVFSQEFSLPIDLTISYKGDRGADFVVNGLRIDVKTYRKPANMLRRVDTRLPAHILVLAEYFDKTGWAELIGWEFDEVMLECPTKDFGYGIINHFKPVNQLKPMSRLKHILSYTK